MCHIANLAASAFLKDEAKLDHEDYAHAPEDLPVIQIDMVEDPDADEQWIITKPQPSADEDVADGGDADAHAEEGDEEEDVSEDELDEEGFAGMTCSPLSMIQRLGTYVHLSRKRRKVFMSLRKLHDSTEKINLPRKDVAIRWNSKYFAIKQGIRLKNTVLAFCQRYSEDPKCPALNEEAFEILAIILPSLHIFQAMTEEYSKAQVTVHRILPDLNFAIKELTRLKDGSGITQARKKPFEVAIAKLEFYFYKFLNNDWVCCAYMLNPESRASALEDMLKAYKKDRRGQRIKEVVSWVRKQIETHQEQQGTDIPAPSPLAVERGRQPVRHNEFASRRSTNNLPEGQDIRDLYNYGAYGEPSANETILEYWGRHVISSRMKPLSLLARDVWALLSSSTSVERLFFSVWNDASRSSGALVA